MLVRLAHPGFDIGAKHQIFHAKAGWDVLRIEIGIIINHSVSISKLAEGSSNSIVAQQWLGASNLQGLPAFSHAG